jgi:hypothetical protein
MGAIRFHVRPLTSGRAAIADHDVYLKGICGDRHYADRSLDNAQYNIFEIGSKNAMVGSEYRMGRYADIDHFKPGHKQGVYLFPILTVDLND